MPLAETITEFVNFILKGVVDLIDHTSIFLLRAINQFYALIDSTKEFLLGRNINIFNRVNISIQILLSRLRGGTALI